MAPNNKHSYTQNFEYDKLGNMLSKTSSETTYPNLGSTALDYDNTYLYYADAPHRVEQIGEMYYAYDYNGNTTEARYGGHSDESDSEKANYTHYDNNVTKADKAFAWFDNGDEEDDTAYTMTYEWDEENRLTRTEDSSHTTYYAYDHEGERAIKYSDLGETLYYDSMWTATDSYTDGSLRYTKNIYIGETRVASKMNYASGNTSWESEHIYYYHTDHSRLHGRATSCKLVTRLGSSNVVTDYQGDVYEHLEYTPYGETWVHDQSQDDYDYINYQFTAKEYDEETGLYYMSARYMNPETSRWVSSDPAGWELVNPMEQDKNGKFQMRSGFSIVESMNPYSYTSNNPIRYSDPTGMIEDEGAGTVAIDPNYFAQQEWTSDDGFKEDFWKTACATTSILNEISEEYTVQTGEKMTKEQGVSAIKAAIDLGAIRENDAYINDWADAANAMWDDLGMSGNWTYSEGGGAQKHSIFHVYFFSTNKNGIGWLQPGEHFVSSMSPGHLWDPWGGVPRQGPMSLGFAGRFEGENGLPAGSLRRTAQVRGVRNLWFNK